MTDSKKRAVAKRRNPVTKEEVFAAADQIQSEGDVPTATLIVARVGGSFTTVGKFFHEWKAVQQSNEIAVSEPVPESIRDEIERSSVLIWEAALTLANARLSAEREALAKDRAELEQERDEAAQLVDQLREELDELTEEVEGHLSEIEALRTRVRAHEIVEAQLAELKAELAAATRAEREAREKAARLEGQLAESRAQLRAVTLDDGARLKRGTKTAGPTSGRGA